jgi:hypothetical protein
MNDRFVESREALSYAAALKNGSMTEAVNGRNAQQNLRLKRGPWLVIAAVATSPRESMEYIRALAANPIVRVQKGWNGPCKDSARRPRLELARKKGADHSYA